MLKRHSEAVQQAVDHQHYESVLAEGVAKGALPVSVLTLGRRAPPSHDVTLCSAIGLGRYDAGTDAPLLVFANPTIAKAYLVGRFHQAEAAVSRAPRPATKS